jgi:uncharacterized membrane protein
MGRALNAQRTARSPRHVAAQLAPAKAPPASARVGAVDALRGGAICLMFVYHFAFDLRFYRVLDADFENALAWLSFRALIVASFLAIVGISIVLADRAHVSTARYLRRVGIIALAALAASAGSWLVFPASFIYFGILHAIALTSLLAWPLRKRPLLALGIGIVVIIAGLALSHPFFDQRPVSWIGFTTHKPRTEDYVPLAPWAGVVLIGIALGHHLVRTRFAALAPLQRSPRWLRWLGRHSLIVYLVHQPLLLGVLWLVFRP